MPRRGLLDSTELCGLFKAILKNPRLTNGDLINVRDDPRRKETWRLLKSLRRAGLVKVDEKMGKFNQNRYEVNYDGATDYFWEFLQAQLIFLRTHSKKKEIPPVARRTFPQFLEFYLKEPFVQEEPTIRKMFLRIMLHGYGVYYKIKVENRPENEVEPLLPEKRAYIEKEFKAFGSIFGFIYDQFVLDCYYRFNSIVKEGKQNEQIT